MKNSNDIPLIADLVLVGGGHAHVHILKMAGMEPLKSTLSQNGIQITLISSTVLTPYSGMLPGFIAGHYSEEEIHLDLRKLCSFGNVRFIHAAAIGITYEHEHDQAGDVCAISASAASGSSSSSSSSTRGFVKLSDGRPDIRYDALSIDVGSSPSLPTNADVSVDDVSVDANVEHTSTGVYKNQSSITPVKPIATFSKRWEGICMRLKSAPIQTYSSSNPFRLIVVGGGAGGLELALSAKHALLHIMKSRYDDEKVKVGEDGDTSASSSSTFDEGCIQISVVTRGKDVLSSHNAGVRAIFKRILSEQKIEVRCNAEVIGVDDDKATVDTEFNLQSLKLSPSSKEQQEPIYFHECLFCTSANASTWLTTQTPFETTDDGFVKVKDTYESLNHPGVFAVGDCCHLVDNPRPKAGVFAVRAGPIVKDNLIAYLLNKELIPHQPQSEFLGLISTGEKYAVASRGENALEGEFFWTLKDEIDRTWMDGYTNLPDMDSDNSSNSTSNVDNEDDETSATSSLPPSLLNRGSDALAAFAEVNMRCGGCGAKVGSTTLTRVLNAVHQRRSLRSGDKQLKPKKIDPDDAAIVMMPKGSSNGAMIHTIDFFRSFISDPFTFGKIAAVHALSDVHAMGADTMNVLALAVVPFAATESMTERTLIDMLSGASDILDEEGCELIGGHTCEGAELALGFTVNGYISDPKLLLRKQGGRVGDKIILTKAIGTGALFAADMRAKCHGEHVEEAIESMITSNRIASKVAMNFVQKSKQQNEGIHSATDVTGFGLIGHLLEMLIANDDATTEAGEAMDNICATLFADQIPFLKGGLEAVKNGIVSSLYRENFRSRRAIANHDEALKMYPTQYPLLFDPQTAGGLLFFVSPSVSENFLGSLNDHGIDVACVIGELNEFNSDGLNNRGNRISIR